MKKIISFIVCLLLLLNVSCTVFANETEKNIEDTTERIFVSNLNLTSKESKENIQILGDDLEQIVLCAKKGDEVWSIGILKHSEILDYEEITSILQEYIPRFDSDYSLNTSDFKVEFYEVPDESVHIKDQIYNVCTSPKIFSPQESTNLNAQHSENHTVNINSSNTIDGSYYYFDPKTSQKYWHNQLTGENKVVLSNLSHPHEGDGNNRFASGYQWFPGYVRADFFQVVMQLPQTFVTLYFKFTENELRNLNVDDNEALEVELNFYNDPNTSNASIRGYSFIPVKGNPSTNTLGYDYKTPRAWFSNFDNAYLDTPAFDNGNTINICVGIYDTSCLTANKMNWWEIDYYGQATPQGCPYDGKFRVAAQRSYVQEGSPLTMPFKVFSEEHEGFLNYGLSPERNPETGKFIYNWITTCNAFSLSTQSHPSWIWDINNDSSMYQFRYPD